MSSYQAPIGPLDFRAAQEHVGIVQRTWTKPIWVHRCDQVSTLIHWCIDSSTAEAIRRGENARGLDEALYKALEFGDQFHQALNPVGNEALSAPQLPNVADQNKAYHAWRRLVGCVWFHSDPMLHVASWRAAVERKEIAQYPRGCDREAVVDALDAYLRRPWLSHPWIDWCFLDALVRHEAIAWADEIGSIESDMLGHARRRRPWIVAMLSKGLDQGRAQALHASTEPHRAALKAILDVYSGLAGQGWTISPKRVRETIVAAERTGARWEPICYALIDRVIARDPAVWNRSREVSYVDWP